MSVYDEKNKQYIERMDKILKELPKSVSQFILANEGSLLPRTSYGYVCDIKDFYKYLVDNNPQFIDYKDITEETLNELNSFDFDEYLHELRKHSGYSAEHRKISAIKSYFGFLIERKYIANKDALAIKHPKKRHDKAITYLTGNEIQEFINSIETGQNLTGRQKAFHEKESKRDLAIITLLLGTGIRVSECSNLDISDLDLNECMISVLGKGKKQRNVYFSDTIKTYLEDYLNSRKDNDNTALFLNNRGSRLSERSIQTLVKKYAVPNVVGVKHITPHKLRSSFGTGMLEKTGDIATVADILGHSSVNTTKNFYAEVQKDRKIRAGREGIF